MEDKKIQEQQHGDDKITFGFWIYLMTDLIMFAVLFAIYAVLHNNSFGAITISEMVNLPFVLVETLLLLTSSFTCGMGVLFANAHDKKKTILFFAITFILGISFLAMEFSEFSHLFVEGNIPQRSAFLSSFFALVGTHGIHIFSGLLWMVVVFSQIFRRGLTHSNIRKLTLLSLFWHFLDIVWIFIFTIVYLMGAAV